MSTPPTSARIVLGCLLARPEWVASFVQELGPLAVPAFGADPFAAALWAEISRLHDAGEPITPIDALGAVAKPEFSDGLKQLTQLVPLAQAETRETFERRLTVLHSETAQAVTRKQLARVLKRADDDPDIDWASELEAQTEAARKRKRSDKRYKALTPARVIASTKRQRRIIPTGFAHIDEIIPGFIIGTTTLVGARTNVGKSSFIAALARNQTHAQAARNIEQLNESARRLPTMEYRRQPQHAQPAVGNHRVQAPHVLVLSVEDDVDDCIDRVVVDLADLFARDYLDDPQRAIDQAHAHETVDKIAGELGGGRLTIADYERSSTDDDGARSLKSIVSTINGWTRRVRGECKEREEGDPPLLVLLDYFQQVTSPEDEKSLRDERRVLAKISRTLYGLAKREHFALVMAAMWKRDADHIQPDANDARGGSDAPQDADAIWTLWPFGPGERNAIKAFTAATNVVVIDGEGQDNSDDSPFDDEPPKAKTKAVNETVHPLPKMVGERAECELIISCDKNRRGAAGWQVPLHFQRDHKRITDAYDRTTIYRHSKQVAAVVATARAHKTSK